MEFLIDLFQYLLSPLFTLPDLVSLILISLGLTLLASLINRIFTDREKVRGLNQELNELKNRLKKAERSGNREEINEIIKKMFRLNAQSLRYSFKGILISTLVILLFLPLLVKKYSGMSVKIPLVGFNVGWVFIYFSVSIIVSLIVRRIWD